MISSNLGDMASTTLTPTREFHSHTGSDFAPASSLQSEAANRLQCLRLERITRDHVMIGSRVHEIPDWRIYLLPGLASEAFQSSPTIPTNYSTLHLLDLGLCARRAQSTNRFSEHDWCPTEKFRTELGWIVHRHIFVEYFDQLHPSTRIRREYIVAIDKWCTPYRVLQNGTIHLLRGTRSESGFHG